MVLEGCIFSDLVLFHFFWSSWLNCIHSSSVPFFHFLVVVLEIAISVFTVAVMTLWSVWFIPAIWYMLSVPVADSNTLVFMGYPVMIR